MLFEKNGKILKAKKDDEFIVVEAWGTNAFRVRVTKNDQFINTIDALQEVETAEPTIEITEKASEISNGALKCRILETGHMEFYINGVRILNEYCRNGAGGNHNSGAIETPAREFIKLEDGSYKLFARFEGNAGEKIYGMGQYQQSNMDVKGCVLELAQRNSQVTVPFYVSSRGYGFLWNNAGTGEVFFGTNYTQWASDCEDEIDYWITAGDTPKEILKNYTEVTGRAPEFPEDAMGLWQCKLRYKTQEEVLEIAREYKRRNIPLDVIVIDFFNWKEFGDWSFDERDWPDPEAMAKELKEMGVRCAVSVWPKVAKESVNYPELIGKNLLIMENDGTPGEFYDAFNPKAADFIWEQVKKNYYDKGINIFWLDADEPENPYRKFGFHYFNDFKYQLGSAAKISNAYPMYHVKTFYDNLKEAGESGIVNLTRSAWAGSQKHAALVWSGDIKSNFGTFRDQVVAGLNIGMAGIPWWTTDIGGFFADEDASDEEFAELLIRWYQFAVFCPVLRMHGFRGFIEAIAPEYFIGTFKPNELWSYGEEPYEIMKKYLNIRLALKDYIKSLFEEASENGSPLMRTMFYEFPEDEKCWEYKEQYMFGAKYLVAPVMYAGMKEREVYLPAGKWKYMHDDSVYEGGVNVTVSTPIDIIPVFEKIG